MDDNKFLSLFQRVYQLILAVSLMVAILFVGMIYYIENPSLDLFTPKSEPLIAETPLIDHDLIQDGIHVQTGLKEGEGLMLVVQNCTSCHSAKMITQNRATKEGWRSMIKWMQQTQGLWKLGANEDKIIAYLATQYAPQKKGRRQRLTNIDWYELE